MRINLDIRKSLEENAAHYFERAKKDKKKIEGARRIVEEYKKKLDALEVEEKTKVQASIKIPVKREWFEKFRWFVSSDGFLVIAGKDATTNELVIKKYTNDDDLVFHTDMAGSPFVVVKHEGKTGDIPSATLEEAATFTAVFSRGWKGGLSGLSVFCVKPEQVTKTAKSGEFIAKGAFMIYGEKRFYTPKLSFAVGMSNGKVMGGPLSAIAKHCRDFVEIIQGDEKISDVAKLIIKRIGGEIDDIIRVLPASCKVKRD